MSLLQYVVGWFVIVFCVPSTLCCGLVGVCVMSPFYTALGWFVIVFCPFYTVLFVGLCSLSLLHCVVG